MEIRKALPADLPLVGDMLTEKQAEGSVLCWDVMEKIWDGGPPKGGI